jgi:hypothetical protein
LKSTLTGFDVSVDYKGVAGLESRQNAACSDVFILKILENGPTGVSEMKKRQKVCRALSLHNVLNLRIPQNGKNARTNLRACGTAGRDGHRLESPVDVQQEYDRLPISPVDRLKESCHPPTSDLSRDTASA